MSSQVDILPAVLPKSWKDLAEHLQRLRGIARRVQIDVVDGHFAHGKTWPYKDGAKFKEVVEQEHGLPLWEELDFEFDLMVADPAAVALDYVHAGASSIIVHASAQSAQKAVEDLVELREDGGAFTVKVGVALGALQSPDDLLSFESQFDFVQVMGIAREGRQGEPFDERARHLVERVRHRYPNLPIQVDGGVRRENVRALVAAGATRLVAGSSIFGAEDVKAAFDALYTEANA